MTDEQILDKIEKILRVNPQRLADGVEDCITKIEAVLKHRQHGWKRKFKA